MFSTVNKLEDNNYYEEYLNFYRNEEQKYLKQHNLKSRKKDYINDNFFQYLIEEYQKYKFALDYDLHKKNQLIKDSDYNEETKTLKAKIKKYIKRLEALKSQNELYLLKNKAFDNEYDYIKKLTGIAIDILIRENMTSAKYIRSNDEQKADFYCNGLYRCFNYAMYSYDANGNTKAFVYFTSAIENGFKEEINQKNSITEVSKALVKQNGLDTILKNVDVNVVSEFEKEYETYQFNEDEQTQDETIDIIDILSKKYNLISLRLLEELNVPRFKRKYQNYDYCIPVVYDTTSQKNVKINSEKDIIDNPELTKGRCIIIEYIDVYKVNEENGQRPSELQKRNLVARKNGHQFLTIYSDVVDEYGVELILERIEDIINKINNDEETDGYVLDSSYIKTSDFNSLVDFVQPPSWYLLENNYKKRLLPLSQDIQEYIKLKEINPDCTRVYDSGVIKKDCE